MSGGPSSDKWAHLKELEGNKSYYVVEFPKEKVNEDVATSVVPRIWLYHGNSEKDVLYCLWPNYLSEKEILNAILKRKAVDKNNGNTLLCQVNILYKTNSYQKAKQKIKNFEEGDVSNTGTSEEFDFSDSRKRKLKMPKRYNNFLAKVAENGSSDQSDDEQLPRVPKIPRPPSNEDTGTQICEKPLDNEPKEMSSENTDTINLLATLHRKVQRIEDLCVDNNRKLHFISEDLKHVGKLVNVENRPIKEDHAFIKNLPLKSFEDLRIFEELLENKKDLEEISSHFAMLGGSNGSEIVRRILAKILDHEFVLKINWSGQNNKHAFKEFKNVLSFVTATVRKNPFSSTMDELNIEGVVKKWFRTSFDRQGGRENRRKRSTL